MSDFNAIDLLCGSQPEETGTKHSSACWPRHSRPRCCRMAILAAGTKPPQRPLRACEGTNFSSMLIFIERAAAFGRSKTTGLGGELPSVNWVNNRPVFGGSRTASSSPVRALGEKHG